MDDYGLNPGAVRFAQSKRTELPPEQYGEELINIERKINDKIVTELPFKCK